VTFSVEYTSDALDALTLVWMAAQDRKAVATAQTRIDSFLGRDPKNAGEEVSEGLWRIEVPPLTACYEVDDTAHKVTVTGFSLLP
jgi:hypothetical protein